MGVWGGHQYLNSIWAGMLSISPCGKQLSSFQSVLPSRYISCDWPPNRIAVEVQLGFPKEAFFGKSSGAGFLAPSACSQFAPPQHHPLLVGTPSPFDRQNPLSSFSPDRPRGTGVFPFLLEVAGPAICSAGALIPLVEPLPGLGIFGTEMETSVLPTALRTAWAIRQEENCNPSLSEAFSMAAVVAVGNYSNPSIRSKRTRVALCETYIPMERHYGRGIV